MPVLDMIRTREQRARRAAAKEARDRLAADDRIRREIAAMIAGEPHDEKWLAEQYTSVADLECDAESCRRSAAKYQARERWSAAETERKEVRARVGELRSMVAPTAQASRAEALARRAYDATGRPDPDCYQAWRDAARRLEDLRAELAHHERFAQWLGGECRRLATAWDEIESPVDPHSDLPAPHDYALVRTANPQPHQSLESLERDREQAAHARHRAAEMARQKAEADDLRSRLADRRAEYARAVTRHGEDSRQARQLDYGIDQLEQRLARMPGTVVRG